MKKAIYYTDPKGQSPVEAFIKELNLKTRAKILARIEFLEEHWQDLRRPYVDSLSGGLYELRLISSGSQIRIVYAYICKDYIVLLHGIVKKTTEVPKGELIRAQNRLADFLDRLKKGLIKLPKLS
jgi:phage-related protein